MMRHYRMCAQIFRYACVLLIYHRFKHAVKAGWVVCVCVCKAFHRYLLHPVTILVRQLGLLGASLNCATAMF